MPAPASYDYAVVRVVPRVDREEFINAGVILTANIGTLQVTSAVIADLTVGTTKITANAVTRAGSAVVATDTTILTTAPGLLLPTLSYTPDTATNMIKLDWQAIIASSASGSSVQTIKIARFMSSVETILGTYVMSMATGESNVYGGTIIDAAAVTTNRVYRMYTQSTVNLVNLKIGSLLIATEFKK